MNYRIATTLLTAALGLTSCGSSSPAPSPVGGTTHEAPAASANALKELLAAHFEATLKLNPSQAQAIGDYRFNHLLENTLSEEHIKASKALNDSYLAKALAISPAALSAEDQLSREFFIDTRERERASEAIPLYLLPVNQFYSLPNDFAVQGSGAGVHPFSTEKDYRDFIAKTSAFSQWCCPSKGSYRANATPT